MPRRVAFFGDRRSISLNAWPKTMVHPLPSTVHTAAHPGKSVVFAVSLTEVCNSQHSRKQYNTFILVLANYSPSGILEMLIISRWCFQQSHGNNAAPLLLSKVRLNCDTVVP